MLNGGRRGGDPSWLGVRERESGKGMRVRERAGGGLVGVGLGLTRGPEAREEGRGSKVMYA